METPDEQTLSTSDEYAREVGAALEAAAKLAALAVRYGVSAEEIAAELSGLGGREAPGEPRAGAQAPPRAAPHPAPEAGPHAPWESPC